MRPLKTAFSLPLSASHIFQSLILSKLLADRLLCITFLPSHLRTFALYYHTMADSFVEDPVADTPVPGTDVEMTEGGDATPAASQPAEVATATDPATGDNLPFAEGAPEDAPPPPRVSFMQYLTSPVVTLLVGSGDNETILTAHQSLLTQSPFFAEACAEFANDGSVSSILPSIAPKKSNR